MYKKEELLTAPPLEYNLCFTYEQLNIISTFQRLFTQLAVLMRVTISSWAFNSPNFNSASQRLMRIPAEFRNAFLIFYGPEIADHFSNLLTSFIANIFTTLEGYGSNNQELLNQNVQKWYRDADNLAAFLSSINLFWNQAQWRNLLNQYVQLKFAMTNALFTGDYDLELAIYDRVFDLTRDRPEVCVNLLIDVR
jgi:hypothetical protein